MVKTDTSAIASASAVSSHTHTLDEKLKDIGVRERERETQDQAYRLGLPYVSLYGFSVAPDALALIPEETAKTAQAICYSFTAHKEIKLATTDPHNPNFLALIADLGHAHKTQVSVALTSPHSMGYALDRYKAVPKVYIPPHGVEIPEETLRKFSASLTRVTDLTAKFSEVSLTDLVVLLMAASIVADASDVHIEAEEQQVTVRFRIDGILHTVASIDRERYRALITRLKLLSNLKINVEDRPQDGHVVLHLSGERVDVRVSCLPTAHGESVVMRLLRGNAVQLSFDDLGLGAALEAALKRAIARPNGMMVVCGPTGSGKTTTLYAILKTLNTADTKIITIEDPIEYQIEGINQSQVDPAHNYTFATGLRSIVRQDPDVILIGEIRDLETADIALQSALTGHLVFSTLHTNDAAGAIPRFLSMGAKPYLLAPALNDVLAQRLVRLVCTSCKQPTLLSPEYAEQVKNALASLPPPAAKDAGVDIAKPSFVTAKGCEACQEIGYKGRVGIYELLTMNPDIERIILSGAISEYQIRDIAQKQGMITMLQDGILKAMAGITTLEEVFRVVQ